MLSESDYPDSVLLESQVEDARLEFKGLKLRARNCLHLKFDDVPGRKFEILIKPDFPDSPPLLYDNRQKFSISAVTYWHPDFTIRQLAEHIHVYARATGGGKMLDSPTRARLAEPAIYNARIRNGEESSPKRMVSVFSTPKPSIQEETKPQVSDEEESLDEETYDVRVADLKSRFKKKEIKLEDYIKEFKKLKKRRGLPVDD